MKLLNLTLVLSLWATLLFAQNNVEWEALPEQHGSKAALMYQASHGNLLAKIDAYDKYIFSNDDAKTWHQVTIPSTPSIYYFYFTSDDVGNLLCFAKNKVYKLDTSDYEFKPLLTFEINAWVFDIEYKDGKMYILTDFGLKIYDGKTLSLLSNNINMQKCGKLFVGKNQNFALKYLSSTYEYEVFTFSETDFKLTQQSKVPANTAILNSDKLVIAKNDSIFTSSDFGKSWQPLLPYRNASFFYVNRQKEMIIKNQGVFQWSADDGQTWEDLPSPKDKILDAYWLENLKKQLIFEHNDCLNAELYLSKDKGKNWNNLSFRVGKPSSQALMMTPNDEILTQSCYVFEQIKDKSSWGNISQFDSLTLSKNSQFTIFPSGKWFVHGLYGNYYTSIDNGETWKKLALPAKNNNWAMYNFIINQNKELLYFSDKITYISKDEGHTWEELNVTYSDWYLENPEGLSLKGYQYLIIKNNSITGNKIMIVNNGNPTPKYLDKINGKYVNNTSNLVDLGNDKFGYIDYLNAGQPIYLHISSDYGTTFTSKKIVVGTGAAFSNIIKGADNSIIVITTKDILLSYDEGDTWISIKNNLPTDVIYSDAIFDSKQHLYIGIRGASIFKTQKPLSKIIATVENEPSGFGIEISPNPATDILNIQIFDNELVSSIVEIFNLEGKRLKIQIIDEKRMSLDISSLPKGMYILRIKNDGKNQVKKFIKQ